MSLNSQHPAYMAFHDQWVKLRDFYLGEDHVKAQREIYLLPTPSMVLDGMTDNSVGKAAYDSYLARAVFPDFIRDAVEIALGLMHQKEPTIELPSEMEFLREKCSIKGESLNQFIRRINVEQILAGRCGILTDLPEIVDPNAIAPYFALYKAEAIINWDESNDYIDTDKLNLVVLDESGLRRANSVDTNNNFSWKMIQQFRVLELEDTNGVYQQGVYSSITSMNFTEVMMNPPAIRGKTLDEIPFIFINSKDLLPMPENGPLLGLANMCLSIYRAEADYRYSLFMQGQDTLVVIGQIRDPNAQPGTGDALRVGAGSRINLDIDGDAKYIGVNSEGLPEQRKSLETDRKKAETQTGRLIGTKSNVESGEALRVRIGAQTASLTQIALTSALGMEKALKQLAKWMGADPNKVSVIPNIDFADIDFEGQELVNLMTARSMGAPLSLESIHNILINRGLTVMDYNSEASLIPNENKKFNIADPNAATKVPTQPNQKPSTQKPQPKGK